MCLFIRTPNFFGLYEDSHYDTYYVGVKTLCLKLDEGKVYDIQPPFQDGVYNLSFVQGLGLHVSAEYKSQTVIFCFHSAGKEGRKEEACSPKYTMGVHVNSIVAHHNDNRLVSMGARSTRYMAEAKTAQHFRELIDDLEENAGNKGIKQTSIDVPVLFHLTDINMMGTYGDAVVASFIVPDDVRGVTESISEMLKALALDFEMDAGAIGAYTTFLKKNLEIFNVLTQDLRGRLE